MVRLLLTTLAVAACCCCLSAQRFRCIDSGNDRFFINKSGNIKAIRPDSVSLEGTDTVQWHFRTSYTILSFDPCNTDPFYPSWPGIKTVTDINGIQHFFTDNGDTLHFNTSGISTWRFCNLQGGFYFDGKLDTIQLENVLGNPDTVFSFNLMYFDSIGNPAPHPFNNKTIKISKSSGFTKSYRLYNFPSDTIVYDLIDAHRYTKREIYGYNLGDVIHWTISPTSPVYSENNDSIIDIDTISPNELQYTIRWVRYFCSSYNPPVSVTYDTDTQYVSETLLNPDSLLVPGLPEQTVFTDSVTYNSYEMQTVSWLCNKLGVKYYEDNAVNFTDSCFTADFGSYYHFHFWFPGVGDRQSQIYMGNTIYYDVDFYNINGEICGTPNYVSVKENESNPSFILYPNPADESITVDFNSLFPVAGYTITDACGRKVMEENFIESGNNIEISSLDNGMYFFSIRFGERSSVKKFLVYR